MVEIIPKPAAKLPLWQNVLFYLSIALLIASISLYFIFAHFLREGKASLKELEEVLAREKTAQEIALEERVFGYQKKIRDFSSLINSHLFPSKFFDFFQKLCHPKVWFSEISLDFNEYSLVVSGETDSFYTLGQQLLIFQQENLIKEVNLSSLTVGEKGKVDFTFDLILDPSVVK